MNLSIIIGSSIKYMSYHYLKLHISNNIKSNNYLKLKLYLVYFAFKGSRALNYHFFEKN